jgi:hypothetical protein
MLAQPSGENAVSPHVTNVRSTAELRAYSRANPSGRALGIREFWRIQPFDAFRQDPDTGTMVYCVPNGTPSSLDALIGVLLTCPAGKVKALPGGGYRLYRLCEIPAEVVDALKRAGYAVYGMNRAAFKGLNVSSLFGSRAEGVEFIYGRNRPGCDICYIGTTADMRRRDAEHWRFGPTEVVTLEVVRAGGKESVKKLARAAERSWIEEFDRWAVPLYNDTCRLPGALRPKEPLIGELMPLASGSGARKRKASRVGLNSEPEPETECNRSDCGTSPSNAMSGGCSPPDYRG